MNGTNWSSINNFEGMITQANTYAPFWTGMLYMIWAILVISFMTYGTVVAILGGSLLAFIIGIFLVYMNVVQLKWVLLILGVILFMILWEALFSKKE